MAISLKEQPVGKLLVIVVGVIAGILAGKLAFDSFGHGSIEDQFEAAMKKDPAAGPLFDALRENFPADYASLKSDMVAQARAGATKETLGAMGFARLAAFRQQHLRDLAQAPSSDLGAYRVSQAALVNQLSRESPDMCARFSFGGLRPTDRPTPATQKLVGEFSATQFRAMAAGIKHPVKRNTDAPTPQDLDALVAQMKAEGLSDRQLATFGSTGVPTGTDVEKCQIGAAVTNALVKLPTDQADRLTAIMIAGS